MKTKRCCFFQKILLFVGMYVWLTDHGLTITALSFALCITRFIKYITTFLIGADETTDSILLVARKSIVCCVTLPTSGHGLQRGNNSPPSVVTRFTSKLTKFFW